MNLIITAGTGCINLGVDWRWWGLGLVVGTPMKMPFTAILQVGPMRVVYYAEDPLQAVRAGVESGRGSGSATSSVPAQG